LLGWLFSGVTLGYLSWLGLLQVDRLESGEE